jgi:hypothetical protein
MGSRRGSHSGARRAEGVVRERRRQPVREKRNRGEERGRKKRRRRFVMGRGGRERGVLFNQHADVDEGAQAVTQGPPATRVEGVGMGLAALPRPHARWMGIRAVDQRCERGREGEGSGEGWSSGRQAGAAVGRRRVRLPFPAFLRVETWSRRTCSLSLRLTDLFRLQDGRNEATDTLVLRATAENNWCAFHFLLFVAFLPSHLSLTSHLFLSSPQTKCYWRWNRSLDEYQRRRASGRSSLGFEDVVNDTECCFVTKRDN